MKSFIDITGMKIGKWTVIGRNNLILFRPHFYCKCECGDIYTVSSQTLRDGKSNQCKRCAKRTMPMIGKKINRWTVLERDLDKINEKRAYWVCICECGNYQSIIAYKLLNNLSTQCRSCSNRQRKDKARWPY